MPVSISQQIFANEVSPSVCLPFERMSSHEGARQEKQFSQNINTRCIPPLRGSRKAGARKPAALHFAVRNSRNQASLPGSWDATVGRLSLHNPERAAFALQQACFVRQFHRIS